MHLFVANTATQPYIFTWTLPESPKIYHMEITPGGQVQILRDVSEEAFNYVVNHHRRYGMLTVSEAKKAGSSSSKVVLVYSEKPLSPDVFGVAEEVNEDIVANQIQRTKEETAYGMINTFKQNPELSQGVEAVELEIIEETPKENDRKGKPLVRQKFSGNIKD